jgi:hypothetical protein
MKIECQGRIHTVNLKGSLCAECGTDLEWWVNTKKKKAFWIDNGDLFCSKKCVKDYSLSYWNLKEIKAK